MGVSAALQWCLLNSLGVFSREGDPTFTTNARTCLPWLLLKLLTESPLGWHARPLVVVQAGLLVPFRLLVAVARHALVLPRRISHHFFMALKATFASATWFKVDLVWVLHSRIWWSCRCWACSTSPQSSAGPPPSERRNGVLYHEFPSEDQILGTDLMQEFLDLRQVLFN